MVKYLAFVSILFFFSCSKNNFSHDSKLTVHGILSDSRPPSIFIGKSSSSTEPANVNDLFVDDAKVEIIDLSNSQSTLLPFINDGQYSLENYTWNVDHSYQIKVEHEDHDLAETEILHFPAPIILLDSNSILTEFQGEEAIEMNSKFRNSANFYMIDGMYYDDINTYNRFVSVFFDEAKTTIQPKCDLAEDYLSFKASCFPEDTIELNLIYQEQITDNMSYYICSIDSLYHEYNKSLFVPNPFDYFAFKPSVSVSNVKGGYGLVVMRRDVKISI